MDYVIDKRADQDGQYVYTVLDETGRVIGHRKSRTPYVACIVRETNASARLTTKWFRSLSLVGQGQASQYVDRPQFKLAIWYGVHNRH